MLCNKCSIDKSEDEFQFKNKKKGVRKKQCKSCIKEYRKKYYDENRDSAIIYSTLSNVDRKKRNRQYIWDYLIQNPCVDCGETDPIVLEFDHRDNVVKIDSVGKGVDRMWGIDKLQEEIDKCDVRCSNCHKRRTAKQQNWYKNINTKIDNKLFTEENL